MLSIGLNVRASFNADTRATAATFSHDRCPSAGADQIFCLHVFPFEIRLRLPVALRAARRRCVRLPWRGPDYSMASEPRPSARSAALHTKSCQPKFYGGVRALLNAVHNALNSKSRHVPQRTQFTIHIRKTGFSMCCKPSTCERGECLGRREALNETHCDGGIIGRAKDIEDFS
jgi:hypothetical protein